MFERGCLENTQSDDLEFSHMDNTYNGLASAYRIGSVDENSYSNLNINNDDEFDYGVGYYQVLKIASPIMEKLKVMILC